MKQSDLDILNRYCRFKDSTAFSELVNRHKQMVFGVCCRVLRNTSEAEEVTQKVFINLIKEAGRIRTSVGGWLHKSAVFESMKFIRSEERRRNREEEAIMHIEKEPSVWEDIKPHVDEAVASLPEKLRGPLILYYYEQQGQKDVAEELKLSQSAVSRRLEKAIEQVRRYLKKAGLTITPGVLSSLLLEKTTEAVPAMLSASLLNIVTVGTGAVTGTAIAVGAKIGIATTVVKIAAVVGVTAIVGTVAYQLNSQKALLPIVKGVSYTKTDMYQWLPAKDTRSSAKGAGTSGNSLMGPHNDTGGMIMPVEKPSIVVAEDDTAKEDISSIDAPLVYGKITDEGGNPLEGVSIKAYEMNKAYMMNAEETQNPVETTTNNEGQYAIKNLITNRNYVFLSHIDGYAEAKSEVFSLTESKEARKIDIVMQKGIVLTGYVRSETGVAIPGAKVVMTNISRESPHAVTDKDGKFELKGVTVGVRNLYSYVQGYFSSTMRMEIVPGQRPPPIEILLKPEGTHFIEGKVIDGDKPVKGARVKAFQKYQESKLEKDTQTGADGRYRIEGFINEPIDVTARSEEKRGVKPDSTDVDFILTKVCEIRGRAIDDETGEPVITPLAITTEKNGQPWRMHYSFGSSKGEFHVTEDGDNEWVITINADGYVGGRSEPIRLREGETLENLVIKLKRGRTLHGKVADELSGEPVLGASANISKDGSPFLGAENFFKEAFTSNEGIFWLNGVPEDATSIVVRHPEYMPQVVRIPESGRQIEVILSKGTTLEGRVFMDGEPVNGAEVNVSKDIFGGSATTKDDGSYKILGLAQGEYWYDVNVQYGTSNREIHGVLSVGNRGVTKHDFALTSGMGVVEGTVYLKAGVPADGIHIELSGVQMDASTETDMQGRYRLDRLYPGTYNLHFYQMGGKASHRDVVNVKDGEEIGRDFILEGTCSIEGYVKSTGVPIREIDIVLSSQSGSTTSIRCKTDIDGHFKISDIQPGSYIMTMRASTCESSKRLSLIKVELSEGMALRQDIVVQTGTASVKGIVHGGAGTIDVMISDSDSLVDEIQSGSVLPWGKSVSNIVASTLVKNGKYEIKGLPAGKYNLIVYCWNPEGVVQSKDSRIIILTEGEVQAIDFQLQ